ncbi:MAG: hypothetical protein RRY16_01300 [Bacilli bacterium]
MINIESIKDYIGNIPDDKVLELATRIYMITDFICDNYPKYKKWFFY